jgi:vitamin B12 transporter
MPTVGRTFAVLALIVRLSEVDALAAENDEPLEVRVEGERASSRAAGRDETAASFVIRRDEIRSPGAGVADALARVPGVQVARSGAGSELSTAAIRGATAAQTPVYLSGIRLNDDVTGTADLSTVPLFSLDRIEVYRGNAPLDADRLGIGGAIFLEPRLPHALRAGLGAGVGSFGELSTMGAATVGSAPGFSALASVRRDAARNDYSYVDDGGTRFDTSDDRTRRRSNADSESYDAWAIAVEDLADRGRVLGISNVFVREQGVTGLSAVPATAARLRTLRLLGGVSAKTPCPSTAGADCEVELGTSAISSSTMLRDPLRELAVGSTQAESRGQRLAQNERIRRTLGRYATLTLSAGQEVERLDVDLAEASAVRARRVALRGAGTAIVHASSKVDAVGLFAVDCHTTIGRLGGDSCDAVEPTGRVGARWNVDRNLAAFANLGRYVRVPTLGELFGVSPSLRGNADLVPERGVTIDGGGRWSTRLRGASDTRLFADLFGFARFASDLIGYRRSSFGAATPYNLQSARVLGLELALGAQAFRMIRAELSATALDPRDTTEARRTTNDLLPFRSRLVTSPYAEVFAEPAFSALHLDRLALGARASYRSSEVADPAGLIVIEHRTLVDVDLVASFWGDSIVSRFRVANVFDVESFDVVGYPLPGRSVHGSLEAWW